MGLEGKQRRFGLGTKLNIMLIAGILLVSVGLLTITYRVHCRKVDGFYTKQAERAVSAASNDFTASIYLSYLWEMIDTDEFRAVREQAVAANDEQVIRDWMLRQHSAYLTPRSESEAANGLEEAALNDDGGLYGDYMYLAQMLARVKTLFDIKSVYIQYEVGGVTYNVVDPDESLLVVGSIEKPIEDLSQYSDNERIPPTICRYGDDLLCIACEPIVNEWDGNRVIGLAGVDVDMSEVVRERHWFLVNSALFIAMLTLAAIVATMLLTRKMVTKPLKQLAEGAMGFASGDEGYTKEDVIQLPIRSNDEIGELYHEIQSMQGRIVDYTGRLTTITAERERVNTELRMATRIQASMLPNRFPAFPDRGEFDLYASMDPAKEVGGDFYDFFLVDDDHLALVIADVSDKGVPAALFMMSAKIIINYRTRMGGTPSEILTAANGELVGNDRSRMFVTVWLGILELSTGRLTCANAGHEYPILRGQDGAFRIYRDKHGLMVGAMKKSRYQDYELRLAPGDAIFVYTDGVPEASNAAGEFYGMERLEAALNRIPGAGPREILEGVKADVAAFADGADQFDDLTMLCLAYRGSTEPGFAPENEAIGPEAREAIEKERNQ